AAGATLYHSLCVRRDLIGAMDFDFEAYPGGFWHEARRILFLPIPSWVDVRDVSMAALKPLVESRHWGGLGRVRRMCLVPVSRTDEEVTPLEKATRVAAWKAQFCSLVRLASFAESRNIDDIEVTGVSVYLKGWE